MFYGRQYEINKLEGMYSSNKFEFLVVYGRRRVGKTTLIKEFCKDKKAIYFMAREVSGGLNLQKFSEDVFSVSAKNQSGTSQFLDWEKAFDYIYEISKKERVILVIDEYPYLANGYKGISSILQAHIDMQFKETKLFLVLCGSSMNFMEYQVLGYKSPLYGRRTAQFKIKPFFYDETADFLQGFSNEEKATIYGVTGGIPEYLKHFNNEKSFSDNLKELFFEGSGILFEEPSNLLKQELREPAVYNGIIEAIALGATRLNEIATKNNMESNKCGKYVSALMHLGIVKKEKPISEVANKKSIYLIEDFLFRFWYSFIFPNMSNISLGAGEIAFERKLVPHLENYMGHVFEEICKQYMWRQMVARKTPLFFGEIGRWWGTNPDLKRQEEIDILATDGDSAIFGECKWTNAKLGEKVFDSLIAKAEMFPRYKQKYYYLFSKNGFTESLLKLEKEMKNVFLIDLDDMFTSIIITKA